MVPTYERVVELMGKTPDDPLFKTFVGDLNDPPVIFLDNKASTEYQFPNSGLDLSFMKGPNCFTYAFFILRSPTGSTKSRFARFYRGNLPAGITFDDDLLAIRRKLGLDPISSAVHSDPQHPEQIWQDETYELSPLRLTWSYNPFLEKLTMLTLAYIPGNDWIIANGTQLHP